MFETNLDQTFYWGLIGYLAFGVVFAGYVTYSLEGTRYSWTGVLRAVGMTISWPFIVLFWIGFELARLDGADRPLRRRVR